MKNLVENECRIANSNVWKAALQMPLSGESGLVPTKYQNLDDLGAITNFVFQGENNTGNPDITKIGTQILKAKGRYDEKTKRVKPFIEE